MDKLNKIDTTYLEQNKDRVTLHVTDKVFQLFRRGEKTSEYRPLYERYYRQFEKFRTMYAISLNYRVVVRIYRAYTSEYMDFICTGLTIVNLPNVPNEVTEIYGQRFQSYYKLDLIR